MDIEIRWILMFWIISPTWIYITSYNPQQHSIIRQDKTGAHDDVIKWKHFPGYWPFVRGIHRSPLNSHHKGQWRGSLVFSWICTLAYGWINNRDAGDLRRHRAHYDVTVMQHEHCRIIEHRPNFERDNGELIIGNALFSANGPQLVTFSGTTNCLLVTTTRMSHSRRKSRGWVWSVISVSLTCHNESQSG